VHCLLMHCLMGGDDSSAKLDGCVGGNGGWGLATTTMLFVGLGANFWGWGVWGWLAHLVGCCPWIWLVAFDG
jgi:hypothetical protein